MTGGHAFAFGIERKFEAARHVLAQARDVESVPCGGLPERRFRGIARQVTIRLAQYVIAERQRPEQAVQRLALGIGIEIRCAGRHDPFHAHFVLSNGSRLVDTNKRDGTQGFRCW